MSYTNPITLTAAQLMKQAGMTAHDYMLKAVESIDQIMGEGYAKAHPELIGQFMQTAALDFMGGVVAQTLQEGLFDLGTAIEQAADPDK